MLTSNFKQDPFNFCSNLPDEASAETDAQACVSVITKKKETSPKKLNFS